jgi:uncharacterized membrane protein YidH (DUF202 family)
MAGVAEENRRRIAGALCVLGVILVLAGVWLIAAHQEQLAQVEQRPTHQASRSVMLALTIQQVLFWLLILIVIFGVSVFAFLRWSRRFREWMFYRPHPPTPADDVWTMHRLPEQGESSNIDSPPPEEQ